MAEYGVTAQGYVRKPLAAIKAELEARLRTEFGSDLILSPQSPMGQLVGLVADMISEADLRNLDVYQSYDPDQAEGDRLTALAALRRLARAGRDDDAMRAAITFEGQNRSDVQDLTEALRSVSGVTYAQVFLNETGSITNPEFGPATVTAAVIGGADMDIAGVLLRYVAPGITTYGNTEVVTIKDGYARGLWIVRPITVPVTLTVNVREVASRRNDPMPTETDMEQAIAEGWAALRLNGMPVTPYRIRSILESRFSTVEFLSLVGERDEVAGLTNGAIAIDFLEIAEIDVQNVTVEVAA